VRMYLQRAANGTHESETSRIGDGIVEVPELGRGIIMESEGGKGRDKAFQCACGLVLHCFLQATTLVVEV